VPIHQIFGIASNGAGTYNLFINTAKLSGAGIHTDANINFDVRYTTGGTAPTQSAITTGGGVAPNKVIALTPGTLNTCQSDSGTSITVPVGSTPGTLTVSGWIRIVINGHVSGQIERGFAFVSAASGTDCGTDIGRSYWRAQ
jgi:hypothetical protein